MFSIDKIVTKYVDLIFYKILIPINVKQEGSIYEIYF